MGKQPQVEIRELSEPLEIELAVQHDSMPKVTAKRELRVAITIIVPGSRLPMRVRNAIVLVSEMEMSTVLIGRDLLDHLGFNFARYLSDNYESVRDSEANKKVKASSYTGVTYGDQCDDPITPQVDLSAQFRDDTTKEIEDALA